MRNFTRLLVWSADYRRTTAARYAGRLAAATGAAITVTDVLQYVSYSRTDLVARLRRAIEGALRSRRLTLEESGHLLKIYQQGLSGYTYLEADKSVAYDADVRP